MRTHDAVFELFLNYACQAKCAFCYNPPITDELLRRELSFAQAAEALYAAARGGAKKLNLHGGEVTLRDDLPKILRLARKVGFTEITLVTNGVRLGDERYARSLIAAGVTHVRMSLHAGEAVLHDRIVVVPGAFERLTRGIAHLKKLGVPVGLNFVIVRANAKALPAFLRRFVLREKIEDVIVYFPHERGMMGLNAAAIGVSYSEARGPLLASAALLDKAGKLGALLIANVPPCAAPELADLLLDWERDPGAAPAGMLGPEGRATDLKAMKDGQKGRVPACRACALKDRCRGVEPEYVRRFGDGEFRALATAPPALAGTVGL
ncbi:MAG: radical SAM protein [Elusimicrobia bacterium]|nr:radical SAM protein [Elusimicrobiota bacterium]